LFLKLHKRDNDHYTHQDIVPAKVRKGLPLNFLSQLLNFSELKTTALLNANEEIGKKK
jgi:hypothetical protein